MLQTLDIISVNIWQILISLANLLIMYLILKKFLFGPVQKVISTRQKQVDDIYGEANKSREDAESMRQEYEEKLATARDEADGIVRSAVQTAQRRSDTMVPEAAEQVSHMKQKAQDEMVNAIEVGDSILTTSGFYGVIIDISDEVVIVEFGSNKN